VCLATVFAQGFIADVVDLVFDGPMPAPKGLQLFGPRQLAAQAGDAVGRLAAYLTRAQDDAATGAAHDLCRTRPVEVAGERATGFSGARLLAAMTARGIGVGQPLAGAHGHRWQPEKPFDLGLQLRLVSLNHHQVVPVLVGNLTGQAALRQQRIHRRHAAA
jgi:hypothetical protein